MLGPEHLRTLGFISDNASIYQALGKYALAEGYAAQAWHDAGAPWDRNHPKTMQSAADLALAYLFLESECLSREALEFNPEKQPDDWRRFRADSLLGASLAGQKKYAEAEPLLLEGYEGMVERKGRIGWMGVSNHRDPELPPSNNESQPT